MSSKLPRAICENCGTVVRQRRDGAFVHVSPGMYERGECWNPTSPDPSMGFDQFGEEWGDPPSAWLPPYTNYGTSLEEPSERSPT